MMHEATLIASATTDEDWRSGAAAILDSYEDAMWDEMEAAVSGASPVKSPAEFVHSLDTSDGQSLIRGDEQGPVSGGGGVNAGLGLVSTLDAVWAAGVASRPTKGSKKSAKAGGNRASATHPLTWASVASEQVLDCAQLPNAGAMQLRRQKNRDCMRRARQRQREELKEMKSTVARLEKQYSEMCLRASATTDDANSLNSLTVGNSNSNSSKLATSYAQVVELVKRLGAENLYLKAEIQQQATWKLHLYRILESRPEMDGPRWAQQFQQPALGGAEALRMQLDRLDEFEAAQVFGFHPLTELDLTRVILDNNRAMSRVQNRLLLPSSLAGEGRFKPRRMQTFGWDVVQKVEGSVMECVFTKKFTGLNVAELMQKTWANDMRLDRFKKVKCETSRLEVLQQINPNAYVLGRDVISPTDDISTFRSVFVRFLIETSRKIPASSESMATPTYVDASCPSTPPMSPVSDSETEEPMLEATGYVLGTQSVDIDGSHLQADTDEKLAWAHLSLSIEFLNVVNPVTGEEYQQLRWTGRTDYRGEEHAHRNAGDTLQGMLRWELLTIAPALNLVSLSLE
ncbi:bZIP transcription factor 1 [Phytophthora cinnamomi]|uniref:bZIP transcription factor 1 n=1 Tax=Phytophthora cinnamomi TaxID=4785 RepID=UPI00355A8F03|nr:bZIP transcription factor 1 [Phytophthora cinnamomi]